MSQTTFLIYFLDCGPIPHLENGYGVGDLTSVIYACQPGYTIVGRSIVECSQGFWSTLPTCSLPVTESSIPTGSLIHYHPW